MTGRGISQEEPQMSTRRRTGVLAVMTTLLLVAVATTVMADVPGPVQNAVDRLARRLEVSPDSVTVVSAQEVRWLTSALGVDRLEENARKIITPGYRVILEVEGQKYEYHTDMDRRAIFASAIPSGPALIQSAGGDAMTDRLRADLAGRLRIPAEDIQVVSVTPTTFPDSSLGLPRPGEMYAMMITPGHTAVLATQRFRYLYTYARQSFRYGGPVDSLDYSALYLEPIQNEPNLNGNLMQISLCGTNPAMLLAGVSEFYPQHDGSLIALRRTSRSGHELLYLAPGEPGDAVRLAAAFYFGDATVNQDGSCWIAFSRSMVGSGWQVTRGSIAGSEEPARLSLPEGTRPVRIYWHQDNPVAEVLAGEKTAFYELLCAEEGDSWRELKSFSRPQDLVFVLSRSESLVVSTDTTAGKPVTRVVLEWFTGEENPVTRIEGFESRQASVSEDHRFLFLTGVMGDDSAAFTVDLATGEVLQTLKGHRGPARLFHAPSPTIRALSAIVGPEPEE